MKKKSITFVHILNNFTGSPNVLSAIADELTQKGYNTNIISSFNNEGFLSDTKVSKKINVNYSFDGNIFLKILKFLKFQILASYKILGSPKNEIIYINTILPFLPAIFSKLRGLKVIYHIHEPSAEKSFFSKLCFWCAELTADKIFTVSKYVENNLSKKSKKKSLVIYNALGRDFSNNKIPKIVHDNRTLLMACSAREYKGIYNFCEIAGQLSQYKFLLVCNTSENEITEIFSEKFRSMENLKILSTQKNMHPYYASSDIILNLSLPAQFVETFGMTILEGMEYGLPAIVPPVGGITELINEGENGFSIDSDDFQKLKKTILNILENSEIYDKMSNNARLKSSEFTFDIQISEIIRELEKL